MLPVTGNLAPLSGFDVLRFLRSCVGIRMWRQ